MPVETSEDPMEGWEGPTLEMNLYKHSSDAGWRAAAVVVQGRRLYHYDCEEDLARSLQRPLGVHRGWLDLHGAEVHRIETINADIDGEPSTLFSVTITEETGLKSVTQECSGFAYTVATATEAERDALVNVLRFAKRPRWLSDEYSEVCLYTGEGFSFIDRRHHCRRCGGLFLFSSTVEGPLQEMGYEDTVLLCIPCAKNAEKASRWLTKTPFSERALKAPTASITDGVKSTWMGSVTAVTNLIETLASE